MKLPSSGFRIFSQTLEGIEPYQFCSFSSTNSSSRIGLLIFLKNYKYNRPPPPPPYPLFPNPKKKNSIGSLSVGLGECLVELHNGNIFWVLSLISLASTELRRKEGKNPSTKNMYFTCIFLISYPDLPRKTE